ncbi:superfamily II DNA or RNA helicase [Spirosoma oryzae]|uniref:Superfamily II DNA or RNA helicase n=1 Tax=Spirosoma oryzae TaxID=1469603 RepID=A0A2T0SND2_9BACT|nr:DEAD/DEAH box helicase family protein [Spirosoma oryzae]PRY34924.1 superfamily II DNA or RNA helicase [Spirosoma oryzae]
MKIYLPAINVSIKIEDQLISHLIKPAYEEEFSFTEVTSKNGKKKGYSGINKNGEKLYVHINGSFTTDNYDQIIKVKRDKDLDIIELFSRNNCHNLEWLKHPKIPSITPAKYFTPQKADEVQKSWLNTFEAILESDTIKGLRKPQIGAIYSTLSHWTISKDPATIVMPTGTGKTETMLSLLTALPCKKLLIIVPFDALREQTFSKFSCFGILQNFNVIKSGAVFPIVALLRHRPKSLNEVDQIFEKANVIISTMPIMAESKPEIMARVNSFCEEIFIDEAHHVAAPTWAEVKSYFPNKRILQFTATPFRNDKKPLSGKLIYNYPLSQAQSEGYFKTINFVPIQEWHPDRSDEAIAKKAIAQLREDIANGFEHVLMARTIKKERAEQVFNLYKNETDLNPVIIYSKIDNEASILKNIKALKHKIIVCVNMLGEGFDLPQLKIAAIHDHHRTLGITLQFSGRFTRSVRNSDKIGDAHFFANIADPKVSENLEELYNEDSNWNELLRIKSEDTISGVASLDEMIRGFSKKPQKVSVTQIFPRCSAVVYKIKENEKDEDDYVDENKDVEVNWTPTNFTKYFRNKENIYFDDINITENVVYAIVQRQEKIVWGNIKELESIEYDLYIAYWNPKLKLLFINSTNNSSLHEELAKLLIGDKAILIRGEDVFRCFHNVRRVVLFNVGLLYSNKGPKRYVMYTGPDVKEGLTPAHLTSHIKSNVFGLGIEHGDKVTIGCSYKGRIWSRMAYTIAQYKIWCDYQGKKLTDDSISTDDFLKGVLLPEEIKYRPNFCPITIEWPDLIYSDVEHHFDIVFNGDSIPLYAVDIELINISDTGPIFFEITSSRYKASYKINVSDKGLEFISLNSKMYAEIRLGSKRFSLLEWFKDNTPIVRFEDTSYFEDNYYIRPQSVERYIYDIEAINDWIWPATVDIKTESQGFDPIDYSSVQFHVIETIKNTYNYKIIFNDDDKGEAADIVAFRLDGNSVIVELYHCKYSSESFAGIRIGEFYEVCGQAQKCIRYKHNILRLVEHLEYREAQRKREHNQTRFIIGNIKDLVEIKRRTLKEKKVKFNVFIVQPGLSKSKLLNDSNNKLVELFGVTEFYLRETGDIPLQIIANK